MGHGYTRGGIEERFGSAYGHCTAIGTVATLLVAGAVIIGKIGLDVDVFCVVIVIDAAMVLHGRQWRGFRGICDTGERQLHRQYGQRNGQQHIDDFITQVPHLRFNLGTNNVLVAEPKVKFPLFIGRRRRALSKLIAPISSPALGPAVKIDHERVE